MAKKKKIKKNTKTKKPKKLKKAVTKKPKVDIAAKKQTNLNQEEKPEIKKIKKQATAKKDYSVKDFVVYPKHGVGKITAIEKANIGQIEIQFYKIFIEKEKLT